MLTRAHTTSCKRTSTHARTHAHIHTRIHTYTRRHIWHTSAASSCLPAVSTRVHYACVTKRDAHTRHTQHPFSMYRCLRKKVPIDIGLLETLHPFPPLFNVGGGKRGVVWRLRKKIPFLHGRTCIAISTTLKKRGRGRRTHPQHGFKKEPFFADTGIKKTRMSNA